MDHNSEEAIGKRSLDLLTCAPPEIRYQILAHLPDVDKIRLTRVSKQWKDSIEKWLQENSLQIYTQYNKILPVPTTDWKIFYQAVKTATCLPSTLPNGILWASNSQTRIVSSEKYVAWADGPNLFFGELCRSTRSEKTGNPTLKIQNQREEDIGTLLKSDFTHEGEVVHIDDELGIAIIAHWPLLSQVAGYAASYVGFDISKGQVVWFGEKDESSPWYIYKRSNGSPEDCMEYHNFPDGLYIKACRDTLYSGVFQLWKFDIATGQQTCINSNILASPTFEFTRSGKYSRTNSARDSFAIWERLGGRANFQLDRFDLKLLPFRNREGQQDFVAVSYSFDMTVTATDSPTSQADKSVADELLDYICGKQDERPAALVNKSASVEVHTTDFNVPGVPVIFSVVDDGRVVQPIEKSRSFLLIFCISTGEMVNCVSLPEYHLQYFRDLHLARIFGDIAAHTYEHGWYNAQFAASHCSEAFSILTGLNKDLTRYCTGLQTFINKLTDSSIPHMQSIKLHTIQYNHVERFSELHHFSQLGIFQGGQTDQVLPLTWSLGLTYNELSQTITPCSHAALSLYQIIKLSNWSESSEDYYPPTSQLPNCVDRFVINPALGMGLYCYHPDQEEPGSDTSPGPDDPYNHADPDIDPYADTLGAVAYFEEVRDRRVVRKTEDGLVWTQAWMEVKDKQTLFLPPEADGQSKRTMVSWEETRNSEVPDPLAVDEDGMRFGGLWLWD